MDDVTSAKGRATCRKMILSGLKQGDGSYFLLERLTNLCEVCPRFDSLGQQMDWYSIMPFIQHQRLMYTENALGSHLTNPEGRGVPNFSILPSREDDWSVVFLVAYATLILTRAEATVRHLYFIIETEYPWLSTAHSFQVYQSGLSLQHSKNSPFGLGTLYVCYAVDRLLVACRLSLVQYVCCA